MLNWLNGRKTYIVGGAMLIHAVVVTGWADGNWGAAQLEAFAALAMLGFRSAIAKIPPIPPIK